MSLLLGAVALIVVLTQFFGPQHSPEQLRPAILWTADTAKVEGAKASFQDGEMKIEFDNIGGAVASLSMGTVAAQDYPYLHLQLVDPPKGLELAITWRTQEAENSYHAYTLEAGAQKSLWIATEELSDWTGQVSELGMFLHGKPGQKFSIRDFSLYPDSVSHQLAAIYSDLTGFIPWNRAAMNTYTGVSVLSSFYPLILAVALFVLSLLAYGVLRLINRKRIPFNWSVVSLIFLACWICLDLVWQNRLLQQLADTHRLFSGKSSQEKLAAGPDAALVKFVSQMLPLVDADNSRIFVTSSDQYSGMRTAYYLFPHNVFWSLHAPELPTNKFLRKGDYVAVVNPSDFKFNSDYKALFGPGRARLSAQLILSDPAGFLVRLD
ncbi:MAG: hypothetical protein R3E64_09090 [Halioglobus sp.]